MSIAPDMMEKEPKRKRRKREDEDDSQPKRKKSKHKRSIEDGATVDRGAAHHLQELGKADLPTLDGERPHKHKSQPKKGTTENGLGVSQRQKDGNISSSQISRPSPLDQERPHVEKKKHSRRDKNGKQMLNKKATSNALSTVPPSQGQERPHERKKKHRNRALVAATDNPQQDEDNTGRDTQPQVYVADDQGSSRKPRKENKATTANFDPDKVHLERSEAAGDVQQHEPTAPKGEKQLKKKRKRKRIVEDHDAKSDDPQLQESRIAASTKRAPSVLHRQEVPQQTISYGSVNSDEDISNSPEQLAPSLKSQKRPHKQAKRKHTFTDSESEEPFHQDIDNTFYSQSPVLAERLPKIDPDSSNGSPFYLQTSSLYLPLAPISQLHPLEGLCTEHLSPLILTYYSPFRGVILSYHNPRLGNRPAVSTDQESKEVVLAKSIDEYAAPFVWITVDFLILRPKVETLFEGWINLQNEGHIGMVCWNLFNASIGRNKIPAGWKWIQGGWDVAAVNGRKGKRKGTQNRTQDLELDEGEMGAESGEAENLGHFVDDTGRKIGGLLTFRLLRVEVSKTWDREKGDRSFISLEGSLLTEEEKRELRSMPMQRRNLGIGSGTKTRSEYQEYTGRISDALKDGEEAESD